MNIREYNRTAWNRQVESGNPWTVPVSPEVIARAREAEFSVLLTEQKPVPREWFPALKGLDVLCLASGGGQQAPVLGAAGANVTVLDNSPKQLERDRMVAKREGLKLTTVEGDMRDLRMFPDEAFSLVFHPVSNVFVPEVRPVWQEAFRVLRHAGILLAGFMNPVAYLVDFELPANGVLDVKYSIPYSDLESLSQEQLQEYAKNGVPLEFGHSLTDQIGGQCDAGFHITGFYEDYDAESALAKYTATYIATRAIKP
ncbi:MAG: class I SAM-dependent methyltransferase [Anaerolineales bacterium]|nr:class I SAM-dependent methyltransferase [Anaerolineales bacterium]